MTKKMICKEILDSREDKNIPNIIKRSKCGGDGAVREFVENILGNN